MNGNVFTRLEYVSSNKECHCETNINELTSQNAFLKVSNDISQQLQKLNIKFVENSIPQKEIIDRIEDMKQDNASLISAVQTTHELTDKIENVLKTSRNFCYFLNKLIKKLNTIFGAVFSDIICGKMYKYTIISIINCIQFF
jgi:hypothetical protein